MRSSSAALFPLSTKLARQALRGRQHLAGGKPIAAAAEQAMELMSGRKASACVDGRSSHLSIIPAVRKIRELIDENQFGRVGCI
jgi:predicted dehydrogenase